MTHFLSCSSSWYPPPSDKSYHPTPIICTQVRSGVHSSGVHSSGVYSECGLMYNAVYQWWQHCTNAFLLAPPPTLEASQLFIHPFIHRFAFSRIQYSRNWIVFSLFRLMFSLSITHLSFFHTFPWHISTFLLNTKKYPTKTLCAPAEEYLGYFRVWVIMNKVVINIWCRIFCMAKFSTPVVNRKECDGWNVW